MEQALESVRSRAKIQGLFNIETRRCNLENPSGSGLIINSIDLVVLANILFQSSKKLDIIKEAKRVLKKGGEMVIIDWQPDKPMGPPKDLIASQDTIKKMAQAEGLIFKKEITVDVYHWGMIFSK
jgi:ubiquinone/menaquinone biosynthesis C-methylase UbiE